MTDRLRHSLPPRLVIPLVLLLLSGILWLPVRNTQHTPPAETAPVEALPVKTVRAEQQPRLFLVGERIGAIASSADSCPRVVEAAFPSGPSSSTGILPVLPNHRLEACATAFVNNPGKPRGPILTPEYLESLAPIPLPPVGQPAASERKGRTPGMLKASLPAKPSSAAGPSGGSSGSEKPLRLDSVQLDGGQSAGVRLAPRGGPVERSEQLERIAREADIRTRRGFELAGRGAHFSARAEFVRALRLVAQGLDAEHRTDVHSRTLAAGLTALKEAEEFIPRGSRLEADLDMRGIIGGHRTPVLKDTQLDRLTPLEALQCYFTYGQQQLGIAVGPEVAGSMALHALGKLHAKLAGEKTPMVRAAEPKAIVFYQAALLANPRNHMAANDLGAFLARSGRHEDAQRFLQYSLSNGGQPVSWRNLAVVYSQLGRVDLAKQAELRWRSLSGGKTDLSDLSPRVRWLESDAFAQASPRPPNAWYPGQSPPPRTTTPTTPAASANPVPPAPKKTAWSWPWNNLLKRN